MAAPTNHLAGLLDQPDDVRPGRIVRALGMVAPGVRRTGEQISAYATAWHEHNVAALDSGLPVVVALGDSLTQGIGASSISQGYVGRLAAPVAGEVAVVNLARSGARIDDVVEHQLPALSRLGIDPLAVMCTVGSNDLLRSANVKGAARSMRHLVDVLPPQAILATLPDHGSVLAKKLSHVVRTSTEVRGLAVADVAAEIVGWRGQLASDGFHPNDAGYDAWVRAFSEPLENQLRRHLS